MLTPRIGLLCITLIAGCTEGNFGQETGGPITQQEKLGQLQASIRKEPNSVEALKDFGDIHASKGNWNRAMGAYREALLVDPSDREAKLGYGEMQLALGNFEAALKVANRIGGTSLQVQQLRAGSLTGLQRYSEALKILRDLSQSNPRNLDVRSNLALIMAFKGDPAAYGVARTGAFAPDAEFTHIRNLVMIGAMVQNEVVARSDASQLGLADEEISEILAIGRSARTQGMSAFGIVS